VQASDRDVRSVVVRSVDRSVGRHTRSVNRCTRCSVGRRVRTVGKRLLPSREKRIKRIEIKTKTYGVPARCRD